MRHRVLLAAMAVLVSVGGAEAKDATPTQIVEEAKALADKGETLKAAARFGDAIAAAQKSGDLASEDAAAEALDTFFGGRGRATRGAEPTEAGPSRSAVLAATMAKLDPKRQGAFVSASVLARSVLELATETGDMSAVADAVKVAKGTPGAAAAVVAKYAEGMGAVAAGHADAATGPLAEAASAAVQAKWFDLAAHASTELAAAWVAKGAVDKATAAVEAIASKVDADSGVGLVIRWTTMIQARCGTSAQAVMSPVTDLAGRMAQVQAGGGEGAPGQPGAPGGASPDTPIAKLLRDLPKGKPFVTAKCTPEGFALSWATNPKSDPVKPFTGRPSVAAEGGVTVSMHGRSIAVVAISFTSGAGGRGGGQNAASPVRAYYLIAEGETWGVAKDGRVTITK